MPCINGHDKVVASLLKVPGIDVNLKDEQGRTALMYAYSKGNKKIAALLRAAGAEEPPSEFFKRLHY